MKTFAIVLLASAVLLGCSRKVVVVTPPAPTVAKTETAETLRLGESITVFQNSPTSVNEAEVKTALAKLDGEIAELEQYVASHTGEDRVEAAVKLKNLQEFRLAESTRFTAVQALATAQTQN